MFKDAADASSAEHVYEGNWLREFLDHIYTTYYKPSSDDAADVKAACDKVANVFAIGKPTGPMEDLLNQIGTHKTFTKTMTIFRQKENTLKHRVRYSVTCF